MCLVIEICVHCAHYSLSWITTMYKSNKNFVKSIKKIFPFIEFGWHLIWITLLYVQFRKLCFILHYVFNGNQKSQFFFHSIKMIQLFWILKNHCLTPTAQAGFYIFKTNFSFEYYVSRMFLSVFFFTDRVNSVRLWRSINLENYFYRNIYILMFVYFFFSPEILSFRFRLYKFNIIICMWSTLKPYVIITFNASVFSN